MPSLSSYYKSTRSISKKAVALNVLDPHFKWVLKHFSQSYVTLKLVQLKKLQGFPLLLMVFVNVTTGLFWYTQRICCTPRANCVFWP